MQMNFGDDFFFGLMLGMIIILFISSLSMMSYRKTLQLIADGGTCEKLPDGKFYYLVHENVYNDLRAKERKLQTPIGYISNDTLEKLGVVDKTSDERVTPDAIWSPHHRPSRAIRPVFIGMDDWTHQDFPEASAQTWSKEPVNNTELERNPV